MPRVALLCGDALTRHGMTARKTSHSAGTAPLGAGGGRGRRAWLFAMGLAALAHAWVLGLLIGAEPSPPLRPAAEAPASRAVISMATHVVATRPVVPADEHTVPTPTPARPPRADVTAGRAMTAAPPRKPALTAEQPKESAAAPPPADTAPDPAPTDAALSVATTATATPPPIYPTTLPPPLRLAYDVQRGAAHGTAMLHWQPQADGHYVLELQGAGATPALTPHWTSRGALDAAGIAPERFAVSRRGRERHAANFRRDVGLVTFAGPSATWPLVGGAQDRLSWMVQLAAVLEANPSLAAAGERISMMVAGAHGDAGVWTFTVQPQEMSPGADGELLPAWPLRRESGHAHDPQVEVWLAPSLHHLPLKLLLTLPRTGESTEMRLRALHAP